MANLKPYKFVNPGIAASANPAVSAARTQTLALNRLGATVSSITRVLADVEKVSILRTKNEQKEVIAERRRKRLEKDAAAEEAQELKKAGKSPAVGKKIAKKLGGGLFGFIEKFIGPLGTALISLGTFAIARETLEYLGDPENQEKITTFLDRTFFVFNKLKEFGQSIADTIGDGLDFIFGKETTLEERLNAFGKIAMAIGGIAGMIAAAGGIRDLLDAGDDLLPDGPDGSRRPQADGPERPRKPTPTNPSGANPDAPGPRGRPSAPDIKATYGDAAEKAYKKVLSERGDDAARAFANALEESGGSVTKAQQKFNRFVKKGRFPKIEPPKPNALQRIGNFFGGIRDSAVKQGTRLKNFAVDQGGRLLKSLQGLPGWAAEQYNKMSAAARKKWDDVSKVGQMLAEKGNKWASAAGNKLKAAGNWVVDGGKKALSNLGNAAKNFFMEKIMTPLKPIIDPIAKKASQIGQALFDALMKIPGAEKILEVLKKKGINSMGDVAQAGSKLGKRAAAVLPVIGGIVNLAFAYDRAANGDSIGALIEGTSGILDIAGLATAGAGSVASMLLDGYMFARDFIPQLQQGEEAIVDAVGARGLKTAIDNILSKLPNIGEIINMFMGKSNEPADKGENRSQGGAVPLMASGGELYGSKLKFKSPIPQYPNYEAPKDSYGQFFRRIYNAALAAGDPFPEVVAAQACEESDYGRSPLARAANNLFGQDAPASYPASKKYDYIDPIEGKHTAIKFSSIEEAIKYRVKLWKKYYGNAKTPAEAIRNISRAGYNPHASYPGKIDALLRNFGVMPNKLRPFALGGSTTKPSRPAGPKGLLESLRDDAGLSGIIPRGIRNLIPGGNQSSINGAKGNELASLSGDYALQQTMDYAPVPMILQKIVPLPTAVAINTGGAGVVSGVPSSLTQRMG